MAHANRNSISSLLPLPTTIVSHDSPTSSPVATSPPAPPPPALGVHLPHGSTFSGTHPLPLNASNILLHNSQFPASHSSTHAGGIQPSASFFKPMRPGEQSYGSGPSAQRYPLPSTMGLLDTDDIVLEDSKDDNDEVFKTNPNRTSGHLAIPHPLSPTFSTGTLSPSLSHHRHHHSNHSLEDLKQHEDRGLASSDTEDGDQHRRAVNTKPSKEPLIDTNPGLMPTIPGTPSRIPPISTNILSIGGNNNFNSPGPSRPSLSIGPGSHTMVTTSSSRFGLMRSVFGSGGSGGGSATSPSLSTPPFSAIPAPLRRDSQDLPKAPRRNSLDVSINTKKSKRNSVYKPRLTFESIRRSSISMSKDDASRRESFVGTTEDEMDPRHPYSERDDGILLTPTKPGANAGKPTNRHAHRRSMSGTPRKDRARSTKRMSFAGSTTSSRTRSPSSSIVSSDEDDSSGGGMRTPTPGLFNPTPPLLGAGEAPKMKTPLRHPLDPSLVPVEKLERELALRTRTQRRRRGGVLHAMTQPFGSGRGRAKEKQPGLPIRTGTPPSSTHSSKKMHTIVNIDDRASVKGGKEGRLARRYELHPSRNRFYFGGRVMTGGDSPWAFLMSLCLVFGLAGIWFGTTGVWWWREAGRSQAAISLGDPPPVGLDNGLALNGRRPGTDFVGVEGRDWTWVTVDENARRAGKAIVIVCAYLAAVVVSSMMVTAFSDPGILPRGLDPDPPYPANSPSDGGMRAPMPRDLKVRSDVVRVKYCPTCKTYRPPRASHCKMCDNCVDGCDHHCQWVNNCIGSRNYTTFFVLLMSAFLTMVLIIVTSALHLYYLTVWQGYSFGGALRHGPGSAVGFCLAILVIWPVGALLSYHLRLLLLNISTIEQIRNQAHKTLGVDPAPPNPFSHGSWRKNFISVLCRPQGLSWLNASAVATEDRRDVNPGLLGGAGLPTLQEVEGRRTGREGALDSARSDTSGLHGWMDGINIANPKRVEEDDDEI